MENQKMHKVSNFWFGFLSGSLIGLGGAFLLGTKKGRQLLHHILELSENLEENLTTVIKELEQKFEKKKEATTDEVRKNEQIKGQQSLNHLLNKIKNRLTF